MSVRLVLGARISAGRRAKKMTQGEVAEAVGVGANQVSRWERGQAMPGARHLGPLAEILDMDREELFVLAVEAGAEDNATLLRERDEVLGQLRELLPLVRQLLERAEDREEAVNH